MAMYELEHGYGASNNNLQRQKDMERYKSSRHKLDISIFVFYSYLMPLISCSPLLSLFCCLSQKENMFWYVGLYINSVNLVLKYKNWL